MTTRMGRAAAWLPVLLALVTVVQGIACPAQASGETPALTPEPAAVPDPAVTPDPAVSEIRLSIYTEDARKTLAYLESCMDEADCYGSWTKQMGGMSGYEKNWIVIMINLPAGKTESFLEAVGREEEIGLLERSTATPVPELSPGETPSPTPVAVEMHSRNNSTGYLMTRNLPGAVRVTVNVHVKYTAAEKAEINRRKEVRDFFEHGGVYLIQAGICLFIGLIRWGYAKIKEK